MRIEGLFRVEVRDPDGVVVAVRASRNRVTNEFMNYLLDAGTGGSAQALWYVAPFTNNVTPSETWTAATFPGVAGELTTQYSEANRPAWLYGPASSQTKTNQTNPAVFTIAASNVNIRGFAILSAQGKGATTGMLMAASRLPADLLNLQTGYTVSVRYDISLQNAP
ncbi:MAG: hypothetical protein NZ518_00085 [Dehalococcoidia bacterium]|nr:hypothetical protein [Dehalococcoidia bacterium]